MKALNTPSKRIVLIALVLIATAVGSAFWAKGQPPPQRVRKSVSMLKIGSNQTAEFNVVSRAEVSTSILVEFDVYGPTPNRPESELNKYRPVQSKSHQVTLIPGEGVSIPFPDTNDRQYVTASILAHINAFGISIPISTKDGRITNTILIPCDPCN